jgi:hypothetical protein
MADLLSPLYYREYRGFEGHPGCAVNATGNQQLLNPARVS